MKIEAGSRTSRLARWQTDRVIERLREAHPDLEVEFVGLETLGDEVRDKSIPEIGGKGLFTERLERALLADEIDLAVHSLKDLPTDLPDGLVYAGSPGRGNPADALVSDDWSGVAQLPADATVATGSRRRRAQLRRYLPDVQFAGVRGNIGTRLEKLRDGDWDAMVMAAVALERLDRTDEIAERLDPTDFVPAVGQGAIGIEIRDGRDDIRDLLEPILDRETTRGCRAERRFLEILEGGCTVPIGGYCYRDGGEWHLHGWVGNLPGATVIEDTKRGADPVDLADRMADQFIERGAREILDEIRERDA